MRRTILAFSALALAAGCDPGDFGAALDKAPVRFIGAPSGFGSDVGRTLLALDPPAGQPKVAARLLFAGIDTPSLAVADFDGNGKPRVQTASSAELGTLGLSQGGISSASWLVAPPAAGSAPLGMIVLGTPGVAPAGGVAFLNLVADSGGKLAFETAQGFEPRPAGHFGLAVGSGRVTQVVADEAIVVSDSDVRVLRFPIGDPVDDVVSAKTCAVALQTPPDLHRSLAVANLLSPDTQQIAVGLPVESGIGKVVILQYGLNPASGAVELFCTSLPGLSAPSGSNPPGFGTALAAVPDMNGDHLAELVVGAPPDQAYLFYSPFDGIQDPKRFTNGDANSEFGQRVALVHIGLNGAPELAITALQADVGSTKAAGQVLIYALDGDGTTPIATLYDSTPTANTEFFGVGLADLEFNSGRACAKGEDVHLLVAGADTGIFTFFAFPGSQPDPRCFAQK
jgi:FG-GAP repeat